MLARASTFALDGLDPLRIWAEVDIRPGLPSFTVVGLADAAVREARERVRAAILNSGFEFPQRRITANLAPAHLPKVGPGFDVALAVGILAASGQVSRDEVGRVAVFGELSLGGELRPAHGVLAVAEGTLAAGLKTLILPREGCAEASLVGGIEVAGAGDLREVARLLAGERPPAAPPAESPDVVSLTRAQVDLADVRGQDGAVQALEIAAAGDHNLLLQGPPGTGKTMLARRLPSILPPLGPAEALEVARIHSIVGLSASAAALGQRPFRAPHHTISAAGLVGGGHGPRPGEVTLAHRGVLFLDELPEFPRSSLEALRQPLEDEHVGIVRGQRAVTFPACFMLVAASNPCPCGHLSDGGDRCRCSESDLGRYRRRLSGPLLDRMDLLVPVLRPSAAALSAGPGYGSAAVRERVLAARERQSARLTGHPVDRNGRMDARTTVETAGLDTGARRALRAGYERSGLSARGHHRVIRVARTIADLEGRARVDRGDVLGALSLRQDATGLEQAA